MSVGQNNYLIDGISIILVRCDEKSQSVPTPAGITEFHVLVTGCALSPHQTSICPKCLILVLETEEARSTVLFERKWIPFLPCTW